MHPQTLIDLDTDDLLNPLLTKEAHRLGINMDFMVREVGGEEMFSDESNSYGFIEEEYLPGESSSMSEFAYGSQVKLKTS